MDTAERRRKRSNFAGSALCYWLGAVAERFGLFGLILADSGGFVVASSLGGPEAEELAAVAPLVARDGDVICHETMPMAIRRMVIDRTMLYLCAVGARNATGASLRTAEGGIQRILTVH